MRKAILAATLAAVCGTLMGSAGVHAQAPRNDLYTSVWWSDKEWNIRYGFVSAREQLEVARSGAEVYCKFHSGVDPLVGDPDFPCTEKDFAQGGYLVIALCKADLNITRLVTAKGPVLATVEADARAKLGPCPAPPPIEGRTLVKRIDIEVVRIDTRRRGQLSSTVVRQR